MERSDETLGITGHPERSEGSAVGRVPSLRFMCAAPRFMNAARQFHTRMTARRSLDIS
jgi:hypothetical protein